MADIDFITSNPVTDGYRKAESFRQQNEANELANTYSRQSMPDRLRQQKGASDVSQAAGDVAMATRGENIKQEQMQTAQAGANLRSTDLSNDAREVEALGKASTYYAQGQVDLGNQVMRQYGHNPDDPQFQAIAKNSAYWGAIQKTIETAKSLNASPAKIRQRVEATAEGFKNGTINQSDPAAPYASGIDGAPAPDDEQIFKSRAGAGAGRKSTPEIRFEMLTKYGGMSQQEAAMIAAGKKLPDELTIQRMAEQATKNDDPYGIMTPEQKNQLRVEHANRLRQEFAPDPAAPAAPGPTPPAAPGTTTVPNPFQNAAPTGPATPASQETGPKPMSGPTFNQGTTGPGGVTTDGYLPNGGNAGALEDGLKRYGSRLSEADPTSGAAPAASQAAAAPTGSGAVAALKTVASPQEAVSLPRGTKVSVNGIEAVRVDTRDEAMALPPGTAFVTPQGKLLKR